MRWLFLADRYSGWVHAADMGRTATTLHVWERLLWLIMVLGFPYTLRLDMGPEFWDKFMAICRKFSISHQACSVENHQSNRAVERTRM